DFNAGRPTFRWEVREVAEIRPMNLQSKALAWASLLPAATPARLRSSSKWVRLTRATPGKLRHRPILSGKSSSTSLTTFLPPIQVPIRRFLFPGIPKRYLPVSSTTDSWIRMSPRSVLFNRVPVTLLNAPPYRLLVRLQEP